MCWVAPHCSKTTPASAPTPVVWGRDSLTIRLQSRVESGWLRLSQAEALGEDPRGMAPSCLQSSGETHSKSRGTTRGVTAFSGRVAHAELQPVLLPTWHSHRRRLLRLVLAKAVPACGKASLRVISIDYWAASALLLWYRRNPTEGSLNVLVACIPQVQWESAARGVADERRRPLLKVGRRSPRRGSLWGSC